MPQPVLYSFRRCPYAIRARMALAYADIVYELREVLLSNKPQAMLDISAKGTVPVLQLPNGQVIDESLDVMVWALRQFDPSAWLSKQQQSQALIAQNDGSFKMFLDRYKYFQRFPQHSQLYYRRQAEVFIGLLEDRLQQHECLISDRWSLADVAGFPFVRQFAGVDRQWFENSPYQKLLSWLLKFENSDLFLSVMSKHKPWYACRHAM